MEDVPNVDRLSALTSEGVPKEDMYDIISQPAIQAQENCYQSLSQHTERDRGSQQSRGCEDDARRCGHSQASNALIERLLLDTSHCAPDPKLSPSLSLSSLARCCPQSGVRTCRLRLEMVAWGANRPNA